MNLHVENIHSSHPTHIRLVSHEGLTFRVKKNQDVLGKQAVARVGAIF